MLVPYRLELYDTPCAPCSSTTLTHPLPPDSILPQPFTTLTCSVFVPLREVPMTSPILTLLDGPGLGAYVMNPSPNEYLDLKLQAKQGITSWQMSTWT